MLAGLQTHLINTIASSPIASIALQWHTQVKYLTDMPVLYSWATLVVSKKAMDKLKKEDRATVHAVMSKAFIEIDKENQADNAAALAALKSQGISFVKPTKEQFMQWKNIAREGNKKLIENGYNSESMYKLARKHIADYQKKNKLTKLN